MSTTHTTPRTDEYIPKLLNYKTLEYFYGLSKSTMSKKVMYGTFCNIVKVGSKNYFKRADVEKWIDENTIEVA
jgi:predicted DNA-binding transcriptional regulator AlpA